MALIGFVFSFFFAAYLIASGLLLLVMGNAFTGKTEPFGVVLTVVGGVVMYFVLRNAPFTISMLN
jgi:hypothetical protein